MYATANRVTFETRAELFLWIRFRDINIVELLEPHSRRTDFPSHPKQFELALSFERPETIRAIRFFRAARNDSGLSEFFKPLETNSSYPDVSGRPNFTDTRIALFEYPNSSSYYAHVLPPVKYNENILILAVF